MAKKGVTEPTSARVEDALQHALCYGWIDGQRRSRDDRTFLQRFTPRRARSPWSKRNVGFVKALTEAGLMQPARLAEVQRAKDRSEEHTSELQSLMRISSAVFCLKKKKSKKTTHRSN